MLFKHNTFAPPLREPPFLSEAKKISCEARKE